MPIQLQLHSLACRSVAPLGGAASQDAKLMAGSTSGRRPTTGRTWITGERCQSFTQTLTWHGRGSADDHSTIARTAFDIAFDIDVNSLSNQALKVLRGHRAGRCTYSVRLDAKVVVPRARGRHAGRSQAVPARCGLTIDGAEGDITDIPTPGRCAAPD